MLKTVRGLALLLGICGLSAGGGLSPVCAQSSGGEDAPPLPSSVFSVEADKDAAADEAPAEPVPPLNVISAPSDALEDETPSERAGEADTLPEAGRPGAAENRAAAPSLQPADEVPPSGAKRADTAASLPKTPSVRAEAAGTRSEAGPSGRAETAPVSADTGRQNKEAKRREQKHKRRDPGTHSRQSVRGMLPAEKQDRPAVSEPAEIEDETAPDVTAAKAAEAGKNDEESSQERVRPRGTHAGSTVRGYVAPVRSKAAPAETEKPAAASVPRRRVLPGQYGEALDGIIAEELRVRK